ncbi:MAG: LytR C-terminal domain-containing protein [Frankiales bacterium]|nr:LytR C-terminal domain-containing protein [Frankiales bacterium]
MSASAPATPSAPAAEPSATTGPRAAKVPVTVLNNSRRSGLAHHVAGELASGGWPIARVGNFRGRLAETTLYYPAGQLDSARLLARHYPSVQRLEPRPSWLPGHGLTLVVTRYWQG